jgi:DNA-binding NarL/FixJ family response regulator
MEPAPADVLIIEDQAPMRQALRKHLESAYPAAAILEAADGASALELCRRHAPRVVLTDLGLPDVNGLELIPQIKALPAVGPVIVVSMHADAAYVNAAHAAGAAAYVTKDNAFRELLPLVSRVLGGMTGKISSNRTLPEES